MKILFIVLFILFSILPQFVFPNGTIQPKANMVEKEYVELVQVGELDAELQDEDFIFLPFSMTGDSEKNIFIFDRAQSTLFKLDSQLKIRKKYRRIGQGPGDFSYNRAVVFINIGLDGYLYANERSARKMMRFSKNLEFRREYKYKTLYDQQPTVDANGNIYFTTIQDNNIVITNQAQKKLYSIELEPKDLEILFYEKPKQAEPGDDRSWVFTPDSSLLVFLGSSSTLFTVGKNKKPGKINIWPRDALIDYKSKLEDTVNQGNRGSVQRYIPMFGWFMIDNDKPNIFYLQYGRNKTKGINALYQFTTKGELKKVLFLKMKKSFVKFFFKLGNKFYARSGEKLIVLEEDNK